MFGYVFAAFVLYFLFNLLLFCKVLDTRNIKIPTGVEIQCRGEKLEGRRWLIAFYILALNWVPFCMARRVVKNCFKVILYPDASE